MLKPAVNSNLHDVSTYSLVIAIAKRARAIAEEAELNSEILTEKPVSLALAELEEKKYVIVEPEELQ